MKSEDERANGFLKLSIIFVSRDTVKNVISAQQGSNLKGAQVFLRSEYRQKTICGECVRQVTDSVPVAATNKKFWDGLLCDILYVVLIHYRDIEKI